MIFEVYYRDFNIKTLETTNFNNNYKFYSKENHE